MINPTPTPEARLNKCGFYIGQEVEVFDGYSWGKKGDVGNNECFWIPARINSCSTRLRYNDLLVHVTLPDLTESTHLLTGVRQKRN